MATSGEIGLVKSELAEMHDFFTRVVQIIPSFDITNPEILPYGLNRIPAR